MDHESISDRELKDSRELLEKEANDLLSEIERLEKQRQIQSDRLKNSIHLVRLPRYSRAMCFPNEM